MFREQPIKFRTTTATACSKLPRADALDKLRELCATNAKSLRQAIEFCATHGIGCFRVTSQVLPLKTHPQQGYQIDELPDGEVIRQQFVDCAHLAAEHDVRLVFHPDQFVVLNSPKPGVVAASIAELEYQAEVAEWIGADVINIHGGGAYGDKSAALEQFARSLDRLSDRVRSRLTVENDDKIYTPADLLPLCRTTGIPLVYDVHHHRCCPDGLSIEEATEAALATWRRAGERNAWRREPLFHISSPLEGWDGPKPQRHHDDINLRDFPRCWETLDVTVEVEAKAKELAVAKLKTGLERRLRRAAQA